ncbi:MAG: TetR/AcrR family transcriptional regulator [Bacteroidetes bacterium]|nr:TetR/AcrR family transcriptional regulator [Bacteroidota bacterium]
MGVKERKERDRQEMRDTILQSAHQLFVDKGFDDVSIRNIAEAIEYSPATIYLYFKDKNEIFYALHMEAFKIFNEYMFTLAEIQDPFMRLMKMGERYMEFTFKFPKYYDIMFIMQAPMNCDINSEEWKMGEAAHCQLENLVKECQDTGHFTGKDYKTLSFLIWSTMHGMCSLALRDRMKIYVEEERSKMLEKSFTMFKQILETI